MNLQFVADGLVTGALIGLGAIGVTLTYSILRFANFAHGEFIAWGAYATVMGVGVIGFATGQAMTPLGPFSFGWPVLMAGAIAMGLTALLALALDAVLFRLLRARGSAIIMVMASFGASMALRSLLEFLFTSAPVYFSREIQIAIPLGAGIRMTPDQLLVLGIAAALVVAMFLVMTRTTVGRSMRAVSENPMLATVVGVDVERVIRAAPSPVPPASSWASPCRSGHTWASTCSSPSSPRRSSAASVRCRERFWAAWWSGSPKPPRCLSSARDIAARSRSSSSSPS